MSNKVLDLPWSNNPSEIVVPELPEIVNPFSPILEKRRKKKGKQSRNIDNNDTDEEPPKKKHKQSRNIDNNDTDEEPPKKRHNNITQKKRKRKNNIYDKYEELLAWKNKHEGLTVDYWKLRENYSNLKLSFQSLQKENKELKLMVTELQQKQEKR